MKRKNKFIKYAGNLLNSILGKSNNTSLDMSQLKDQAMKGRQTYSNQYDFFSNWSFVPRRIYQKIDVVALLEDKGKTLTYQQIMAILPDLDADASMALWNTLRLVNRGWKLKVYKIDGKTIDTKGQELAMQFANNINKRHGGIDNLIGMFASSAYLQGAISAEAVLSPDLHLVDIAPVNPFTIYYKHDEQYTDTLVPYQYQIVPKPDQQAFIGNYIKLNEQTFYYLPVDPFIGDPYGRSAASPAVADIFFNLQTLFDLRKVIHTQGWPRIDIKIITDTLTKNAPAQIAADEKLLSDYIKKCQKQIEDEYDSVAPDDAYIHTDAVEVGFQAGASSGGRIFDPTQLLRSIERRTIRALKQLPVLMGSNEGTTETHGTVQYEIYAAGIEAFQKLIEDLFENMFEMYLQLEGIQSVVEFNLDRVRTADRKADADAETIEITNEITKRDEGWIDNDEASINITGSEPVLSEEEVNAKKQAALPPALQTKPDDTGNPGDNNANATVIDDQKKNKITKKVNNAVKPKSNTKLIHDFKTMRGQFEHYVDGCLTSLGNSINMNKLMKDVMKENPRSSDFKGDNKIDDGSPLYKSVKRIVAKYFDTDKVNKLMDNMSDEGGKYILAAYENVGQKVINNLAKSSDVFKGVNFKLNDQGIQRMIDQRSDYFPESVFETTQKTICSTIVNGYNENKSLGDIATDLRGNFDSMNTSRSVLIANTELAWASGKSAVETMKRNNVEKKQWQTMDDGDVEDVCQGNQDQGPIPVDDAFESGDDAEPAHPNCRCNTQEVLDEMWQEPDEAWAGGNDNSDQSDNEE